MSSLFQWQELLGSAYSSSVEASRRFFCIVVALNLTATIQVAIASELLLSDFNGTGFDYQFLGFNQTTGVSAVQLDDPVDGWGGAGIIQSLNLTPYANSRFVVDMYVNPGNSTNQFDLELLDSSGRTGKWRFNVSNLEAGVTNTLIASTTLANPTTGIGDFQNLDLANITSWQLLGDFNSPNPFNMSFDRIAISEPVAYPGQESGAPWRTIANMNIDTHRMADLQIRVTDSVGNPINGANLSIEMQEHEFGFGSAVQAFRLRDNNSAHDTYKQKTADLFNMATLENNLKWPTWEGEWGSLWTQQGAQNAISWLAGQEIPVRGHTLVWPGYDNLPANVKSILDSAPLNSLQQQLLRDEISSHINEIAGTFAGQLAAWDVVNEVRVNHDIMDNLSEGDLAIVDWFQQAEAIDPAAAGYINDFGILTSAGGTNTSNQQHYADTIQFLLDNNAPVDGIGFQSHFSEATLTGPEELWTILDRFQQFGLDMQVTEFDFNTTNEQLQADYTRDFLTAMFAHEGIDDVVLWGFWEDAHWRPDAALFRSDWSVKPNGEAYLDLVFGDWWTDESLQSGVGGLSEVRGFKGEYQITVTHNGETQVLTATLTDGGLELEVSMAGFSADFDGDGIVVTDDLGILFNNYGANSGAIQQTGDANGDGFVNGSDFLLWQRQHEATAVTAAANVPEPSSAISLWLLFISLMAQRLRVMTT